MHKHPIRTDLALENHEFIIAHKSNQRNQNSIDGVIISSEERHSDNIHISTIQITSKRAERILHKPIGTYITMEVPTISETSPDIRHKLSHMLSLQIQHLIKPELADKKNISILVIGLGNRSVTADSLGPRCIEQLNINRHLQTDDACDKEKKSQTISYTISALTPGVMAQNGIETGEIVKGVINRTKPDLAFVIDALAARTLNRLYRTIQISNTGIHPGSGVGNNRLALTKDNLGIPVIAIGIPTVIDAASIVYDTISDYSKKTKHLIDLKRFAKDYESTLFFELQNMYVTGKDIDCAISEMSHIISEALNLTFSPNGDSAK